MLILVVFIYYFNVKNICKVSVLRIKFNKLLSNYRNVGLYRYFFGLFWFGLVFVNDIFLVKEMDRFCRL